MKAILEVNFKLSNMIDKETLEKEFKGDALKLMKWLYKQDGLGIFDKDPKLVRLEGR